MRTLKQTSNHKTFLSAQLSTEMFSLLYQWNFTWTVMDCYMYNKIVGAWQVGWMVERSIPMQASRVRFPHRPLFLFSIFRAAEGREAAREWDLGRGIPFPWCEIWGGCRAPRGKIRFFTLEMVHSDECSHCVTQRAKEMQTTHVPLLGWVGKWVYLPVLGFAKKKSMRQQ